MFPHVGESIDGRQVRENSLTISARPRARECSHTVANRDGKPPARGDMLTGWSGVFLSDVPERDSRAVKSSAYMVICIEDSTGRNQGIYKA